MKPRIQLRMAVAHRRGVVLFPKRGRVARVHFRAGADASGDAGEGEESFAEVREVNRRTQNQTALGCGLHAALTRLGL